MSRKIKLRKVNFICFLLLFCLTVSAQKLLTGRVLDTKKEPLVGALVHVKGTEISSTTDLDGYFYLSNVKPGCNIEFTYIGYEPKKIKYRGQDTMNVVLWKDYGWIYF